MIKQEIRKAKVQKRHKSLRVKLEGTTEFPRLAVYRSTKHIYAQLIDDEKHVTVCSASSIDKLDKSTFLAFIPVIILVLFILSRANIVEKIMKYKQIKNDNVKVT